VFKRLADTIHELEVLGVLGQLELQHGDPEKGRELVERSNAMAAEAGWLWWQGGVLHSLALDAVVRTGNEEEAELRGRQIVAVAKQVEHRNRALFGLAALAWAAGERGDRERAAQLWATVEAEEPDPGRHGRFDRDVLRPRIPDLQLPSKPMTFEEAVEYALR
jgi:ATP/maltotriose-dependent transcriptional regulator MalT